MHFVSYCEQDTYGAAQMLADGMHRGGIVAVDGDLGVGKSVFCRGLIQYFCPHATVKSPTYTVMNVYPYRKGEILHMDAYRLTDAAELDYMGFDVYRDSYFIWLIEWSENIRAFLDTQPNVHYVRIERLAELPTKRLLTFHMPPQEKKTK